MQRPCGKGAWQCEKVKGGQVAELRGSGLSLRGPRELKPGQT